MQVDFMSAFLLAYYLGLIVFVFNFLAMRRIVRTYREIKQAEKNIVKLLMLRRRKP